ncbi:hypothetical protein JCM19233_3081 [Vibrio astriarenae]|nr:hypothetical protein JCM19233_3081 [Vibrio sp. C7]
MKINNVTLTQAHLKVGVLTVAVLTALGIWLAPSSSVDAPLPMVSDGPANANVPASINAPMAVPPHSAVSVETVTQPPNEPQPSEPIILLDEHAQALIERSASLASLKMETLIAQENKRHREAKAEPKRAESPSVGFVPPTTIIAGEHAAPVDNRSALERVRLSGLFVSDDEASAYLSLGGAAHLIKAGDSWQGIEVIKVDSDGVTLEQGGKTRTLKGAHETLPRFK